MRLKIGATIPTVQYGNLMPEIEVEHDDYETALSMAMPHIERLWEQYAEEGKQLRKPTGSNRIKAFVGGEIDYDALTHTYSWNGETYLSASQYAKQFKEPFDSERISTAMAKKYGVEAGDIKAMWQLKSEVSTGFGTAIHAAIELCERFRGVSEAMERTTHIHTHPIIKKAVEGFYRLQDGSPAQVEAIVVDHKGKKAGRIDRLVIGAGDVCRVQDIKTDGDLGKNLDVYWKQLEFYKQIMEANGWAVEGMDIFGWNGEWRKETK